jgi:CheY-like chemotaxis protein
VESGLLTLNRYTEDFEQGTTNKQKAEKAMAENSKEPSLDGIQKSQIEDWLRATDKRIREGRYLAADELLQKVFAIQPHNEVAHSYQDRIQFLIKQLSQRVGIAKDIHSEIRKYSDLIRERRSHRVSTLLVNAQKLLEDGFFKKANDNATRVLSLDPENIYAKALLARLTELQQKAGGASLNTENEYKFCSILRESWHHGQPSEAQEQILAKMQKQLGIADGRRIGLERDIKNILYKDELRAIWMTGGLSAFTPSLVDSLREKFAVSHMDHSFIESSLIKELRKNRIKGTVLVADGDENALLEITHELRSNFYAIISAESADEALMSLKTVRPNIILSEVNFPAGRAGFDLFEFIRSSAATWQIPFMFMTRELDRMTLQIGKRLGVDEFFTKPLDYELLIATIDGKLRRTNPSERKDQR